MFRRMLILSGVLITAATALLLAFLVHIPKEDYALYEEILKSSNPQSMAKEESEQIGHQDRELIEKQLWFTRNRIRLNITLQAEQSRLTYSLEDVGVDLVEEMQQVRGWMQEELFYRLPDGREAIPQEDGALLLRNADPTLTSSWIPRDTPGLEPWQQVREFEAEHATYLYWKKELVAKEASVRQYYSPGHQIRPTAAPPELLMTGVARRFTFTLVDREPKFHAETLSASIYSPRGLL